MAEAARCPRAAGIRGCGAAVWVLLEVQKQEAPDIAGAPRFNHNSGRSVARRGRFGTGRPKKRNDPSTGGPNRPRRPSPCRTATRPNRACPVTLPGPPRLDRLRSLEHFLVDEAIGLTAIAPDINVDVAPRRTVDVETRRATLVRRRLLDERVHVSHEVRRRLGRRAHTAPAHHPTRAQAAQRAARPRRTQRLAPGRIAADHHRRPAHRVPDSSPSARLGASSIPHPCRW